MEYPPDEEAGKTDARRPREKADARKGPGGEGSGDSERPAKRARRRSA
jgi:hypothetical protein